MFKLKRRKDNKTATINKNYIKSYKIKCTPLEIKMRTNLETIRKEKINL